eukprot:TRINITY_DN848_c0_g1_i1.p1 TRINITY_DN848_c0_g1~~TRINITY_DN848_c0_g1_i1.p1  ORF type:complete len:563 (+),score=78.28 TRINITY_DN848_c0_g1_i1:40-1689(+)
MKTAARPLSRCVRRNTHGATIDIPVNMTLPAYLEEQGQWSRRVGQVAFKDAVDGRELHFDKIRTCITACGKGLDAEKVGRLLLFMPNSPEFMIAMLGAASRGIPVSTANPVYHARELQHQIQDSEVDQILTIPPLETIAKEAAERVGLPPSCVKVLGEAGTEHFGIRSDKGLEEPDFTDLNVMNDTAVLPYSSGTTGLPKGVMLSHHNIVANVAQLTRDSDVRLCCDEHSVMLCVLPLFHIYAMVVCGFIPLAVGNKVVTMPRFDPELFLSTVQKEKVSIAPVVPPIMIFLSKHPLVQKYDLSSLKTLYSAAAPCDAELQRSVCEKLDLSAVQAYGMTELSPAATATPVQKLVQSNYTDRSDIVFGSCGKAMANTSLRVVDVSTGETLGPNQEGELEVKGPQVMQGYFKNQKATDDIMRPDGYLRTGDIFKYDEEGNYFSVDRLKELIKVKGFQVAPAELEGILLTHPAVADCAVIPIPDERSGELPRACVQLKPDMVATEQELKDFVAADTISYKHIAEVNFIESVPKSASGKILRRVLRDQFKAASA